MTGKMPVLPDRDGRSFRLYQQIVTGDPDPELVSGDSEL